MQPVFPASIGHDSTRVFVDDLYLLEVDQVVLVFVKEMQCTQGLSNQLVPASATSPQPGEVLPELNSVGDLAAVEDFGPSALLPSKRGTFRYEGSTTTPPCSERVRWIAFAQPVEFSDEQIEEIAGRIRDFNDGFGNNRVLQELNGRKIKTEFVSDDDSDD